MRNVLLLATGLGLFGVGIAMTSPAFALMTQDQAAAEGFVQPAPAPSVSPPGTGTLVPEHPTGVPPSSGQTQNYNGQSTGQQQ